MVNLFSPADLENEFLSPVGFGALMGLLKNYDVINPFVSSTNDSLNRLKPGYEAPVCTVTSLGHSAKMPSRNRTVLVGLVREIGNTMATRFELRSPNPKSNTYLVLAASYMAMLDGIKEALEHSKTPADLEKSISKAYGEKDFTLIQTGYTEAKKMCSTNTLRKKEMNFSEKLQELYGKISKLLMRILRSLIYSKEMM